MKQYVFLFKCRVTFRLRYLPPNATFGTLALYILRLRCFGISNTYKNSFCLLSKTETFQNDVEYVSKMSFWALVGLILWLYIEKLFWELAEISLHETISVFWSNAESRFGCAICPRTLRSVLWLFTSCVWDVVGYRLVKKKQFLFLEQNRNFPKRRWVSSKNVFLSSGGLDSLVVYKKAVLRTCWDLSTWNNTCCLFKFRVTFRLRYLPPNATFGTLALYILRLRCLAIPNTYKNSFWFFSETWSPSFCIVCNCFDDSRTDPPKFIGRIHRNQNTKLPKRRWVRSKNVFLSAALLFSLVVTEEKCFENFLRSLYLEQYVFFVQIHSRILAALVFEGYVWYFWYLHLASEMSSDIEYLKKTAFVSWRKQKLSKTTWSAFQKRLFELWWAWFFGCKWKSCFENLLRSLYMKQYVFLFKCRVTFRLRYLPPNATFGTLALYILRLRCFGISKTNKNSFCFLSKTETFQNDAEYFPKMSFWALLCFFLWL